MPVLIVVFFFKYGKVDLTAFKFRRHGGIVHWSVVTWHHGASCGMAPAPVPDPPRPPLGHLTQPHPQTHHPHHPIPPWGPSLTQEFTAGEQRRAETENCLGPPTLSGPPLGRGLYWPALGRRPRQEEGEGGGGGGGGRPQDSRTRPPDT